DQTALEIGEAEIRAGLLTVAAGSNVENRKLCADVEVVVVRDLGDEDFDEHLGDGTVEIVEDRLDALVILRRGADEQGVGIGIGDDGDLAGEIGGGLGAALGEGASAETTEASKSAGAE